MKKALIISASENNVLIAIQKELKGKPVGNYDENHGERKERGKSPESGKSPDHFQ